MKIFNPSNSGGGAAITLSGAVVGSGSGTIATTLGSFTSADLLGALSDETGTGVAVFNISPTFVTPALGTPASGVATNLTGTAAGLTAGNVTTNANLTGVITSSGNATSIASQTGTGTKFVVDTSPTLVTPNIGVATATSLNGLIVTASTGTITVSNGKTITLSSSLTFTGTDSSSVAFGTGGTVAYTNVATLSSLTTVGTLVAGTLKSVGTGAATIIPSGLLTSNFTSVLNVSTGETDLITYTLPLNTLVTTNQLITYKFRGQFTSSVNAKTLKIYFGTTVVATLSFPVSTAGNYYGELSIKRTGASTQSWNYEFVRTTTGSGAIPLTATGTCSETETADIVMKLTGTGGASSEISQTYEAIYNNAG